MSSSFINSNPTSHNSSNSQHNIIEMSSGTSHKYSIILPTYNERRNLPIIIYLIANEFTKASLDWEAIIVDDNSPDGTLEIAKQLQNVYGEDHIVLRPRAGKLGLGWVARERRGRMDWLLGWVMGWGNCRIDRMFYCLSETLIESMMQRPEKDSKWEACELTFLSIGSNLFCSPRTAYVHGLESCSGDFTIIMDADFSHHVSPLDMLDVS